MKKLEKIVCAALLGIFALLAVVNFSENRTVAQSVNKLIDLQASRANVFPQGDDTTNALTVWDTTGTNGFQISPTLGRPAVLISNNVYNALVYQQFATTNGKTATFRNGVLVSYQ